MSPFPRFSRAALCAFALAAPLALPAHAAAPLAAPAAASARVATFELNVAPERADWTYAPGDAVRFRIEIQADNQPPAEAVSVKLRHGPDMVKHLAKETTVSVPPEGLLFDAGTLDQPGFLRLQASAEIDGRSYTGVATAGFSPEKIQPTQTEPADFDKFWSDSKALLAAIPPGINLTLLPERCTDAVHVYHVSAQTWPRGGNGNTARVYGILCEPKTPGSYPAFLRVPGAGVRAYKGDTANAARGVITLEIGIHGIPVNLPDETYGALAAGALNGYPTFGVDDREGYYYRRVYLSCVRALDILASRPMWNGKDLGVTGGSQGGQLSLVTAGLDPRVTALSAAYPAYCDVTGYLHGRAGGWPHLFATDDAGKPNRHATEAKIGVTAYYDAVNFARRIKAPALLTWGYNDTVCPPTSMHAAYNVITAPKRLVLSLEAGHTTSPEMGAAMNDFLLEKLGVAR